MGAATEPNPAPYPQPANAESFPDFLVRTGRLDKPSLNRALAIRTSQPTDKLVDVLVNVGLISAGSLADGLAEFCGLSRVTAQGLGRASDDIEGLNHTFLKTYRTVPFAHPASPDSVAFAVFDPTDDYLKSAIGFITTEETELFVATAQDIEAAIQHISQKEDDDDLTAERDLSEDVERLRELASDAPVVKYVDRLIEEALIKRSSDIHLEPTEEFLRSRMRVDGLLHDGPTAPTDLTSAVISRIKIMSGLDIAERRTPQDGRMRHRVAGKEVDFRVATAPTALGEGAVIRLLDKSSLALDFTALGLDSQAGQPLKEAIEKPDGIVLVTGPTGSGKTTTLYAGLARLNHPDRKILTIEDPIEYMLPGINQTQVDTKIGRTFAAMLRSFLRQDPDIIMVGEIRDQETAEIAIQASLTGHLVLSTLHTNDAASAVTRLLDMGVESFLISSTVRVIVAQRLIRKLCQNCRYEFTPDSKLVEEWGQKGLDVSGPVFKADGCDQCQHTGFAGRTLIAESLVITEQIREMIHERVTADQLERAAREDGMTTMLEHGLERVHLGETTVEEILRVTMRR